MLLKISNENCNFLEAGLKPSIVELLLNHKSFLCDVPGVNGNNFKLHFKQLCELLYGLLFWLLLEDLFVFFWGYFFLHLGKVLRRPKGAAAVSNFAQIKRMSSRSSRRRKKAQVFWATRKVGKVYFPSDRVNSKWSRLVSVWRRNSKKFRIFRKRRRKRRHGLDQKEV